jgi:hypothetical protein
MLLWFAGMSLLVAWLVFRSPALDYRMVIAGSLLPLADAVTGGAWVLHTLIFGVVLLGLVMAATRRRRLRRRQWLGLPIGTMLHLGLDGTWATPSLFWWPFLGAGLDERLPEAGRATLVVVLMEVAGTAALVWCWHRFGLGERANRDRFWRTGQLPRQLAR